MIRAVQRSVALGLCLNPTRTIGKTRVVARGGAIRRGRDMENTTRNLVAGVVLGAVLLMGCSSDGVRLETVSPSDAAVAIAEGTGEVVLDIRTPEEYVEGIIAGAINIDFYEPTFSDNLDALDKDVHYIVYCRSGNRTGQAMSVFKDLGFTNVIEIDGGIAEWVSTGHGVVLP